MDNQESILSTGISEEIHNQMKGLSLWMQINAIVALVSLLLSVVSGIMMFVKINSIASSYGAGKAMGSTILQLFISAVVSIILNVLLLQASSNIKKGLETTDQGHFNLGLSKMASYFRVMGILIIVLLALAALAFLFIGLAASMR